MTMRDRLERVAIASLVAALFFGFGCAAYFALKHPCMREERYGCTETYCAMWLMDSATNVMMCTAWGERETTCSRCLERAP